MTTTGAGPGNGAGHGAGAPGQAIGAWESLFRAQVALAREFAAGNIWDELSPHEYDVLYTLSTAPEGLRSTDLNRLILLTQSGVSRMIARLNDRGLIERRTDPDDARAHRIALTEAGHELQRAVGRRHARQIVQAMTRALDADSLRQLDELCTKLRTAADAASEARGSTTDTERDHETP
ncbi:MarR family winged helix-turn-helix transcriptional regulator [Streptomyces sp. NPDC096132]|uniref:MarR family winged helix-turn-helix transcriptional regulator n=1 Tax=Streptomyces sp. NPDC096132 TaxID=3366075 RepID=UPI0037FA177A